MLPWGKPRGEMLMCCEETFVERLRAAGLRLTPQREIVLQVLHDVASHATAEEIYARVAQRSSAVELSTVYRTLDLLQQFRLLASIDLGDGQRRYELIDLHGPHHHLHCRRCGTLQRVESAAMEPLLKGLEQACGFTPEPEHLIIPGLCARCQMRC